MSGAAGAATQLADRLTGAQAREALRVLLSMPQPAKRWALEAIAIAAPEHAESARDLKGGTPWQALIAVPGEVIHDDPLALESGGDSAAAVTPQQHPG